MCKLAEEKYEMVISNHHILYDGWSNGIILKEFLKAYQCLSHSVKYNLPIKKKYKDFIKYIQNQDKEQQKKFWQGYLKGLTHSQGWSRKRENRFETIVIIEFDSLKMNCSDSQQKMKLL
ncbi:condensation domain-containing protein [Bacillus sp. OVS6]|nr:condensation domain-containing protein [Bacillus sp. OVS6]